MTRVNLEQTYYVTQIIAVGAIVISLFYVGIQIKQNTQQQRVNAWQADIDKYFTLRLAMAQDTGLTKLVYVDSHNLSELSDVDKARIESYVHVRLGIWLQSFVLETEGLIYDEVSDTLMNEIREAMEHPEYREVWNSTRLWYNESFRQLLDEIIKGLGD